MLGAWGPLGLCVRSPCISGAFRWIFVDVSSFSLFIILPEGLKLLLWSEFHFNHFLVCVSFYCFAHLFYIFKFPSQGVLSCCKTLLEFQCSSVSWLYFGGELLLAEVFLYLLFPYSIFGWISLVFIYSLCRFGVIQGFTFQLGLYLNCT